ncbi:MAG: ATP-binding protein [Rhizobiales bacterium]|nr:ATP-binding protein [Hyphomicrobiales bacterium]NRB13060.1 ATP-binding protein [Hyphomicrobiales bacterium]
MNKLVLVYDPQTIKHLGVSLYSQLPSVLSELVSNSYDADAENLRIDFAEGISKTITITDDGEGMTFDDLNEKYLTIGRNRRTSTQDAKTSKFKRQVIGKKGLGKLSVFGICEEVIITSVKDGLLNSFSMNLADIETSKGQYNPHIIEHDVATSKNSGTVLELKKIRRKTAFDIKRISSSLAKKFVVFDEICTKIYNNGKLEKTITNETKFEDIKEQFAWEFPEPDATDYDLSDKVIGKIFTTETPLRDTKMRGIYLTSRGKIVNDSSFFDARDNDLVHTYMTGYLAVDFIEGFGEDVISTDRNSLNWETDETIALKNYLTQLITGIASEWKKKRAAIKAKIITVNNGETFSDWENSLPNIEKKLSKKISVPILNSPELTTEKTQEVLQSFTKQFSDNNYREYVEELSDKVDDNNIPSVIELLNDWDLLEKKALSNVAIARIGVISEFEKLLSEDTLEVPTLHNFLKRFSWILDPRILELQDEVYYSTLLKENFPEEKLDEANKRIDFLCSNALGGVLYIIEIKRSRFKINDKAITQAARYRSFIKRKYASQSGFSNVVCFVVGGTKADDADTMDLEETYIKSGEVFVKTYAELLEQSKTFHRDFIDSHKSLNKS